MCPVCYGAILRLKIKNKRDVIYLRVSKYKHSLYLCEKQRRFFIRFIDSDSVGPKRVNRNIAIHPFLKKEKKYGTILNRYFFHYKTKCFITQLRLNYKWVDSPDHVTQNGIFLS